MASTFAPAGPPPPGVIPNFDNPTDTLYPEIVATVTLSIVLTTFFTGARLIAKRAMSSFMIEDYFSIVTWVMFVGYSATFMLQAIAGIGRHIWEIHVESAPRISKISWAIELMYCIITWLAKAALLLQLQRTFSHHRSGAVYFACQALIWSNLAFYLGSFFALVFECVPQERIWNPRIKTGHCIDTGALLISMGVINVVSDLMILILPIWAIFHLRLSLKKKLGVSAIFATGILAFACSICRLAYTIPPLHSEDATYLFAPVGMWSIAEISSIILCTSLPLMPRFLSVATGKIKDTQSSQKSRYAQYAGRGTGNSSTISSTRCMNCKNKQPCVMHKSGSKSQFSGEEDEQHLYIHKTISVEMMSHKSEQSIPSV